MAKPKTHRGAAKRFRVTRRGKLLHRRANKAHMLTKKSGSRKRRLEQTGEITVEKRGILRLLRRR
jgi:large subunit ribosomal protein L35